MKRFFFLTLLTSLLSSGQAAETSPKPRPPEGNRYLFVVDTSAGMKRLDLPNRQTLFDLVYFGVDHQMRSNDTFGLWTFDAKLYSGEFAMQVWKPDETLKIASSAATFLKQKHYTGKCDINPVVMSIQGIGKVVKDVNVFIISNGETEMHGTPLDELINGLYKRRATEARKAEKPLITTLVVREGAITNAQVTLPGEKIELPLPPPPQPVLAVLPKTNAPAQHGQLLSQRALEPGEDASGATTWIKSQPVAQPLIMKAKPVPVTPTGNFPIDSRSLSYRATNQMQLVSTTPNAVTNTPESLTPTPAVSVAANVTSPTNPATATNAISGEAALVSGAGEKATAISVNTAAAPATSSVSIASSSIPRTSTSTPAPKDITRELVTSAQSAPLGPATAITGQPTSVPQGANGTTPEAKPSVVVTVASQAFISPQLLITVGCVLLLGALCLLVLVFRRLRRLPEPSIITRSMEKR